MILCVSPNPAVDRTLVIPDFKTGFVYRPAALMVAAGGKGINVARAVQRLKGESISVGFLGGRSGDLIRELMEAEGLKSAWTRINAETRTCVIVTNPNNGEATVLNEHGPVITAHDWERLTADILRESTHADAVCFSGSLPPGASPANLIELIKGLRLQGTQVWVDTSGAPLQAAINAGDMNIKVNGDEAGAILGQSIHTIESALTAASAIQARGFGVVAITLGAHGAVIAHNDGVWYAQPPPIKVHNNVGSGDSFLAGLVQAFAADHSPADALRHAIAAGTANTASAGGAHFTFDDFERLLSQTTAHPAYTPS